MKFDLSLTDPDHIGTVTDIIFKDKDGSILASGDVDMRSYDELAVRDTYKLTVVCDYDLNDGDCSMLVEYYYIRATYTVTYAVNGGDTIQSWSGRYEEAIPYPDATRTGYSSAVGLLTST